MWRLRLDSNTGCLAVEVRDPDLLLARFYTIDAQSSTVQQLALPEAKAWWQGLEDTGQGLVFLHGYGNRQLGQHKGIFAFSGSDASKVWEKPKLAFYGMAEAGLLAYNPEQPEEPFHVLEPITGRASGERLSQQEAAEAVAQYNDKRFQDCLYPMLYHEGMPYFNQVKAFLEDQLQVQAVQAVEYAETGTCVVISYYLPQPDGKLDNELAIFSLSGKLYQKVKIGSQLSAIGSDTFFIFKHNLYFILNKDTLQVFRLLA